MKNIFDVKNKENTAGETLEKAKSVFGESLLENVINDKRHEVLIMKVVDYDDNEKLKTLVVVYSKKSKRFLDTVSYSTREVNAIKNYVSDYIDKPNCDNLGALITNEDAKECEYYISDGKIYKEDDSSLILDLQKLTVPFANELINDACNIKKGNFKKKGVEYISFLRDEFEQEVSINEHTYALLALCGIIYSKRDSSNKNRYSYRYRPNDSTKDQYLVLFKKEVLKNA